MRKINDFKFSRQTNFSLVTINHLVVLQKNSTRCIALQKTKDTYLAILDRPNDTSVYQHSKTRFDRLKKWRQVIKSPWQIQPRAVLTYLELLQPKLCWPPEKWRQVIKLPWQIQPRSVPTYLELLQPKIYWPPENWDR